MSYDPADPGPPPDPELDELSRRWADVAWRAVHTISRKALDRACEQLEDGRPTSQIVEELVIALAVDLTYTPRDRRLKW